MTLRHLGLGPSILGYLSLTAAAASAQGTAAATCSSYSHAEVNKVDLLFVVDNSRSMSDEQRALTDQIPKLIDAITTGQRFAGDPRPFRPVTDLHVGVVSTDMGIPGVEFPPSCSPDGGSDGRLLHAAPQETQLSCQREYPQYQSYRAHYDDRDALANAVACTASLGTEGCGIEQPLESAFKALWPKAPPAGSQQNPFRFISTTEAGTWGRGDRTEAQGGNYGFLRNDPDDPSLIAIVLLTDEEDCSVGETSHLQPRSQLAEDSPYWQQDINLRCYYNKQFLFDLERRYLDGLRALRPGREDLVFFSVIAGVPADLVSRDVLARTDFSDAAARDTFYDDILNDPRMQEAIDPSSNPGSGTGNLRPSCVRSVAGESGVSTAFPPRRLVSLARAFGKHGMVQSICQDDFGPAVDAIVDGLADHL